MKNNNIYSSLQTIANTLFRKETMNIGLISGKMSIVIFYFHYARFTKDDSFRDIAWELLDEIQKQIVNCKEKNYRNGIAGIGIAFDYLIENEFVKVEEDFLDDFDQIMYAAMNEPSSGFSLYDGLTGYAWYWLCRTNKLYSETILSEIIFILDSNISQMSLTELFDVHNFIFETNCLPIFGEIKPNYLRAFRQNNLLNLNESYPRLTNTPVGELVRTYLLKKYWQLDWNTQKSPINNKLELNYSTNLAWEGLYLLSILSPKEKDWIGLL